MPTITYHEGVFEDTDPLDVLLRLSPSASNGNGENWGLLLPCAPCRRTAVRRGRARSGFLSQAEREKRLMRWQISNRVLDRLVTASRAT